MSHRNQPTKHPHRKGPPLESDPTTGFNWSFTRKALAIQTSSLEISQDPKVLPEHFFDLLIKLDPPNFLHPKLDRNKIANIPASGRDLFLRQYLSACTTGMADLSGALVPLKDSALVSFPRPAKDQLAGTSGTVYSRPTDELYATIDPAIAPVESQIPCFNGTFLGILQGRIQKLLKAKGLYPANAENAIELDALMEIAFEKITEERMFSETRAATAEYFNLVLGGKEPAAVTVISKVGGPFVFLWLMSSGLLDDLTDGLLRGKPLMRPVDLPEPYRNVVYEPTEHGNALGFWRLEPETK